MSTYLIIGASSGIGKSLSQQLRSSGHHAVGTYNKTETSSDQDTFLHHLDVLAENMSLDFLPDKLDGIVYCPGSINLKPFERMKPEDFLSDYSLQVVGAIRVLQAAFSKLKKSDNASIVFFSTVAVQMGFPFHTQVSASKGAIEGLTRALAAEYSPTIRVNCIAPSLTDTPLAATLLNTDQKREANALRHPLKRFGTAEDISNMAAFLLSEKSSWMTGQVLRVDGGMSSLKI